MRRLLGMRILVVDRNHRVPVVGVHPPKFGDADFVVIEGPTGHTTVVVNPWSWRREAVRRAALFGAADTRCDPEAMVAAGTAWFAPDGAADLAQQYIAEMAAVGRPKRDPLSVPLRRELTDRRRPCRREFEVRYALTLLHPGRGIAGFWNETVLEGTFEVREEDAG